MEQHVKYDWSRLTHLQLGRYAEYFVKMECVLYECDVYTTEVDDRGIDFVLRKGTARYFDIQVKSIRGNNIFIHKSKIELRDSMLVAVVIFRPFQAPDLYLIPSTVWNKPNALFVSRDFPGSTKSVPEWGINLSQKNMELLAAYSFDKVIPNL